MYFYHPLYPLLTGTHRIGPIAHYYTNSKYYSATKPRPNKIVDNDLPHITIQMPVFKESLEAVLYVPSLCLLIVIQLLAVEHRQLCHSKRQCRHTHGKAAHRRSSSTTTACGSAFPPSLMYQNSQVCTAAPPASRPRCTSRLLRNTQHRVGRSAQTRSFTRGLQTSRQVQKSIQHELRFVTSKTPKSLTSSPHSPFTIPQSRTAPRSTPHQPRTKPPTRPTARKHVHDGQHEQDHACLPHRRPCARVRDAIPEPDPPRRIRRSHRCGCAGTCFREHQ